MVGKFNRWRFRSDELWCQYRPYGGASNIYSYVNNNPLSRIDPSGFDDSLTITVNCCSGSGGGDGGIFGAIGSFFGGLFGGGGSHLSPYDQKLSNAGLLGARNLPAGQQIVNNADGSFREIVGNGTISNEGFSAGGYVLSDPYGNFIELISTARPGPAAAQSQSVEQPIRCAAPQQRGQHHVGIKNDPHPVQSPASVRAAQHAPP